MSTSQTSRINGMTTHTHTHRLGGRTVSSFLFIYFHFIYVLYITHISDDVANNKDMYYFHLKCIHFFAPNCHGTKFLASAEE